MSSRSLKGSGLLIFFLINVVVASVGVFILATDGFDTASIGDLPYLSASNNSFIARPTTIDVEVSGKVSGNGYTTGVGNKFWRDQTQAELGLPTGYSSVYYQPGYNNTEGSLYNAPTNMLIPTGGFMLDPVTLPQGYSPPINGPDDAWIQAHGKYGASYDVDVDAATLASIQQSHYKDAWMGRVGDEDTVYSLIFPVDTKLSIKNIGVSLCDQYAVYLPWGATSFSARNQDWVKGAEWMPTMYSNTQNPAASDDYYAYNGWRTPLSADSYTLMPTQNVLGERIYFFRLLYSNDYYHWYDASNGQTYSNVPKTTWSTYWDNGQLYYHNGYENRRYYELASANNYDTLDYYPSGSGHPAYSYDPFHQYSTGTSGWNNPAYDTSYKSALWYNAQDHGDIIKPYGLSDNPELQWYDFNRNISDGGIPIRYVQLRIEKMLYTRGSMFGLGQTEDGKFQGAPEVGEIFIEYNMNVDDTEQSSADYMDASINYPRDRSYLQVHPTDSIPLEVSYYMRGNGMEFKSNSYYEGAWDTIDYSNYLHQPDQTVDQLYFYLNGNSEDRYDLLASSTSPTITPFSPVTQTSEWFYGSNIIEGIPASTSVIMTPRATGSNGLTFTVNTNPETGGLYAFTISAQDIGSTTSTNLYQRSHFNTTDGAPLGTWENYDIYITASPDPTDISQNVLKLNPNGLSSYKIINPSSWYSTFSHGTSCAFRLTHGGSKAVESTYIDPYTGMPVPFIDEISTEYDDYAGFAYTVTIHQASKDVGGNINPTTTDRTYTLFIPLSGSWTNTVKIDQILGLSMVPDQNRIVLMPEESPYFQNLTLNGWRDVFVKNLDYLTTYILEAKGILAPTDYYNETFSDFIIFTSDTTENADDEDYLLIDNIEIDQYPYADNIFNRFVLKREITPGVWRLVGEYAPDIESVYLRDGTPNPMYSASVSPFRSNTSQYIDYITPYLGKTVVYTMPAVLLSKSSTYKFKIEWVSSYGYGGDSYSSAFYQHAMGLDAFQFGHVAIADIGVDWAVTNQSWNPYNPYSILMSHDASFMARERAMLKATVLRAAFVGATHSSDYNIQYYQNNFGDFPYIHSSNPTSASFVEVRVNFPVSSYYDICLRDSNDADLYDGNRYRFSIDGELYRTYAQRPTLTNVDPYTIAFTSGSQSYPSLSDTAYEAFGQIPLQPFAEDGLDRPNDIITTGSVLRVASGYFSAGEHVFRIQYDGQIDEAFSRLRYDQIVLYYQSLKGYQIPVSAFETLPASQGDWYNVSIFMNSTLMGLLFGADDTMESRTSTTSFQLAAKPYVGFSGGSLPDIVRGAVTPRNNVKRQLSYIDDIRSTTIVPVDAFFYDTDLDITSLRYRINDELTWHTFTNDGLTTFSIVTAMDNTIYQVKCNFQVSKFTNNGLNTVEIKAMDVRGHESRAVWAVYNDHTDPTIAVASSNVVNQSTFGSIDPQFTITSADDGQIKLVWYELGTMDTLGFQPFSASRDFVSGDSQGSRAVSQKHIIYNTELNLTRITSFNEIVTVPRTFFQQGENVIRFYVCDMAATSTFTTHTSYVDFMLNRDGSYSIIEFENFDWRYVNTNPLLNVSAQHYAVGTGSRNSISTSTDADGNWVYLGKSDVDSYEYIEHEFIAVNNSITEITLALRTTEVLSQFPLLVEIVDSDGITLSSAYVYAGFIENSRMRNNLKTRTVDMPNTVVKIGDKYRIRVTPIEAPYNKYETLIIQPISEADQLAHGTTYGYRKGVKVALSGYLFCQVKCARTVIPLGYAGNIRYQINDGAYSSVFTGVCESLITTSRHGANTVKVYVDLGDGVIKQDTRSYLWVDPRMHTPPHVNFQTPILGGVYTGNITVKMAFAYPEYNETYDVQYFLYNEGDNSEVWLYNETIYDNIAFGENITTTHFNSTLEINTIPWVKDGSLYRIRVRISDTSSVNGTYYSDLKISDSDRFTINNKGATTNINSPVNEQYFSRTMPVSFTVVTYGTDIFSLRYYFDDATNEYIELANSPISSITSPGGMKTQQYYMVVPVDQLTEGYHVLNIVVEDLIGDSTYASVVFYHDVTNVIIINGISPSIAAPNRNTAVTYDVRPDYQMIEVYLLYREQYGGQGFRLVGEYTGKLINGSVDLGILPVGTYQITIVATDFAGNVAKDSILFEVQETGALYFILEQYRGLILLLFGGVGAGVAVGATTKRAKSHAL